MSFNNWIDTLIEEKEYDTEEIFEIEGPTTGLNIIPLGVVIEAIKNTTPDEQARIKTELVHLDLRAADLRDHFRKLAQALAL